MIESINFYIHKALFSPRSFHASSIEVAFLICLTENYSNFAYHLFI